MSEQTYHARCARSKLSHRFLLALGANFTVRFFFRNSKENRFTRTVCKKPLNVVRGRRLCSRPPRSRKQSRRAEELLPSRNGARDEHRIRTTYRAGLARRFSRLALVKQCCSFGRLDDNSRVVEFDQ